MIQFDDHIFQMGWNTQLDKPSGWFPSTFPAVTNLSQNQGSFTRLTQWAQQAGFHQAAEWLNPTEQVESMAANGWWKMI